MTGKSVNINLSKNKRTKTLDHRYSSLSIETEGLEMKRVRKGKVKSIENISNLPSI